MPTNLAEAASVIKNLPVNEVHLDQTNPDLKSYPVIYQNHLKDMYNGLLKGKSKLNTKTHLNISWVSGTIRYENRF
jgi:hypothetical protein